MKTKILSMALLCSSTVALAQNCISSTNQVSNGNFSAGNTGFTSGLTNSATCASGTYFVGTQLTSKCSVWAPLNFADHTSGTGNFLIVDGHSTTATDVWRYSATITPYTTYNFSFWARSLYSNPFQLEFTINGSVVGTTSNITTGAWNKYATTWYSGATSGTYTIAIRQNSGDAYRDFGIDDISFGTCNDIIVGCGSPYNMVTNPDFSSGNTGFTSDLPSSASCLEGTYYVSTLAANKCYLWSSIDFADHTIGTGNFLIVDGDEDNPSDIWEQNVTITPYTQYTFSFWARSLYTEAFKIQFQVGGYTLATSENILYGSWHKYVATWNSAMANGTLPLTLRLQTAGEKRDLGIDDIFFGKCGEDAYASTTDQAKAGTASEFSLFPNPNSGTFTITTPYEYEKNIFVYDLLGKVVFEKLNAKEQSSNIDISNLAKGIYHVKVISGDDSQVKKIIVE